MRYPQADPMSIEDFLEWEETQQEKHELIDGRVVPFASASKDHNHIAGNIYVALRAHARPPCSVYGTDIVIETISRSGDNGYRADAVVSCAEEDRAGTDRYLRHPKIVVEVRSTKSNRGKEWDAELFEYWVRLRSNKSLSSRRNHAPRLHFYARVRVSGTPRSTSANANGCLFRWWISA